MSATRAQSCTVTRQGVEWTICCARENMLVLALMLSLICRNDYDVSFNRFDQILYRFFHPRTGLCECITNEDADFLPVRKIVLDAGRQIEPISFKDILINHE